MIEKKTLINLYQTKKLSMQEIAFELECSVHKVEYWMNKHDMTRRTISEAVYIRSNPKGDPFKVKQISNIRDAQLMGMGLGLYWGEGNKKNTHAIRLGNTDPELIMTFMKFLKEILGVKKEKLKFGLQIFSDIEPEGALNYWVKYLGVERSQFSKIIVTISGSIGTYREKSRFGVVTVHCNNKKLRDILVNMLPR